MKTLKADVWDAQNQLAADLQVQIHSDNKGSLQTTPEVAEVIAELPKARLTLSDGREVEIVPHTVGDENVDGKCFVEFDLLEPFDF